MLGPLLCPSLGGYHRRRDWGRRLVLRGKSVFATVCTVYSRYESSGSACGRIVAWPSVGLWLRPQLLKDELPICARSTRSTPRGGISADTSRLLRVYPRASFVFV